MSFWAAGLARLSFLAAGLARLSFWAVRLSFWAAGLARLSFWAVSLSFFDCRLARLSPRFTQDFNLLKPLYGVRACFGLGASSEPLSASWPLARLFWGSSQPFLGLGSGPFIEVEQIPFQDASGSFMVFPSFSTFLAGFQASIYLNPPLLGSLLQFTYTSFWAPCINLLKPLCGLFG